VSFAIGILKGNLLTISGLLDMYVLLEAEKDISRNRNRFFELFTVPRNRRATLASFIVMFMYVFLLIFLKRVLINFHTGNSSVVSTSCKSYF
jgi:hypothetical protein